MFEVKNRVITCGITKAARHLNVSYNHLWCVLTGKEESPALVLKAAKLCPSIFKVSLCKIDWKKILEDAKGKYKWDPINERYVKLRRFYKNIVEK